MDNCNSHCSKCPNYCDIMDADTKKIIAVSDIPHNLEKIGNMIPKTWEVL